MHWLGILSLAFMLQTDFSNTPAVVPVQGQREKVEYAQPAAKRPGIWDGMGQGIQGVGKGMGNAAGGAAKGAGWIFSELMRPVEAIRTGLIDVFGVKETRS